MCKEMTIGQGGRRIDVGMGTKKDEWGSSASLCLMSMSVTAKHNPMDETTQMTQAYGSSQAHGFFNDVINAP